MKTAASGSARSRAHGVLTASELDVDDSPNRSVPITCSTSATMIIRMPSGSLTNVFMCSGATNIMHGKSAGGIIDEHPSGDAAVRARDANLPLDARPLANEPAQVVEHFGEVAAGFTLRQHGGDEEPGVEQRHALREGLAARPAAACRSSAGRRAA